MADDPTDPFAALRQHPAVATVPAPATPAAPPAASRDDPYAGLRTSAAVNPPAQTPSFNDSMLGILGNVANAFSRVGNRTLAEAQAPWLQIGNDLATTFHQGYTLGVDDYPMAAASGQSISDYRQKVAAANERLGFAAPFAAWPGYALGPGKFALAGRLADAAYAPIANYVRPTVARYLSGIFGSAGEGGVASYLGSMFKGGSVSENLKASGQGIVLGGLGGATGGVQSTESAPSAVPGLKAQEAKIYKPLDDITFHGSDVMRSTQDTTNAIINGGGQNALDLAKSTAAIVKDLNSKTSYSAADIQDAQEKLWDIARSPSASDEDKRFAPLYANGLFGVHENAQPIAGTVNGRPAQAGDAADILEQGKPITAQRKNAEMLDNWARMGILNKDPYYPANAARKELADNPQFYATRDPSQQGGYDVSDPDYQGLAKLAGSAPPAGPNYPYQAVRHAGYGPMEGLGASLFGGGGALAGGHLGHAAEGAMTGLGLYGALLPTFNKAQSAYRAAGPRAAYEDAYPKLTGGFDAPLPPQQPAPIRDALRQILFGTTATGWTPY
jgi:hypothetical protein